MEELVTPEAKIDQLLQLLAVLIERLGGEIVVGRTEFSMFEGVPIIGRNLSSDYVLLRLGEKDEQSLEQDCPLEEPE